MTKSKHKIRGDFEAILAGFDAKPETQAPARPARRRSPKVEKNEAGEARQREEFSFRGLIKKFSFPWPARMPALFGGIGRQARDAYEEAAAEAKPSSQPAAAPGSPLQDSPPPAKSEDDIVAGELGLGPGLGMVDLKRIRRDFAKRNHPDRFAPAQRLPAERRMAIANMLIDELVRQSRAPH